MTHCQQRVDVGAFLLGALEPGEIRRVARHLRHCPACAAEHVALGHLPELLARVPADQVGAARPPPSEAALHRLRATAGARAARRSRPGRAIVGAAAAVALFASVGLGVASKFAPEPSRPTLVAAADGISARATLRPAGGRTRIDLSLSGVPGQQRCRLVAVAVGGRRDTASTWTATYAGEATVRGWTGLPASQIDRLVIETFDGRTLLVLPARDR